MNKDQSQKPKRNIGYAKLAKKTNQESTTQEKVQKEQNAEHSQGDFAPLFLGMDAAGSANFAPRGFTDEFGFEIDIAKVNGTSGTVLARSLLLNFVLSLLFVIIGGVVLRFVLGIVLYSMHIPKENGRKEGERELEGSQVHNNKPSEEKLCNKGIEEKKERTARSLTTITSS